MTESLTLALFGGVVGMAFAYVGVAAVKVTTAADLPERFAAALGPTVLPRLDEISIDAAAFGFAAVLSVGAAILFGLWPALRLARIGEFRSQAPAAIRNAHVDYRICRSGTPSFLADRSSLRCAGNYESC
jgi:hypothetical protein